MEASLRGGRMRECDLVKTHKRGHQVVTAQGHSAYQNSVEAMSVNGRSHLMKSAYYKLI